MSKTYALPMSEDQRQEVIEHIERWVLDRITKSMGFAVCVADDDEYRGLSCPEFISHLAHVTDELSKLELRCLLMALVTSNVAHGHWDCLHPVARDLRFKAAKRPF